MKEIIRIKTSIHTDIRSRGTDIYPLISKQGTTYCLSTLSHNVSERGRGCSSIINYTKINNIYNNLIPGRAIRGRISNTYRRRYISSISNYDETGITPLSPISITWTIERHYRKKQPKKV